MLGVASFTVATTETRTVHQLLSTMRFWASDSVRPFGEVSSSLIVSLTEVSRYSDVLLTFMSATGSSQSRKTGTFLQLLKETGIRPGEAWNLKWIDLEKSTVNILPEKNSNPRQLRISTRLMAMLNRLPRRYEYVLRNPKVDPLRSMEVFRRSVAGQRKRLTQKLQNPRISAITEFTWTLLIAKRSGQSL